ncbi:MAG: GNAT family N-acetyltransferase [Actinomycetota bacterium]|nr:GNAT family N-acetyltransferase [Actinomycetota bacterium]
MDALARIWPAFGLRIGCGPLQLAAVRDDDVPVLVDLAAGGIHDPGEMPFAVPWSTVPLPALAPAMATYYWRQRAAFEPDSWSLDLVVRHQSTVVGVQGFGTRDYPVTRTGETGSWLGREHQGRGIGTLMRQTMCAFLFDHLDAAEVTSAAFTDNPASLAVSRKVGYADNGLSRERRQDVLAHSQRLTLTADAFVRPPYPLAIEGLDAFRRFIGLNGPGGDGNAHSKNPGIPPCDTPISTHRVPAETFSGLLRPSPLGQRGPGWQPWLR